MADETKKIELQPGIETEVQQVNPYEIKPSLERALETHSERYGEAEKISDDLNLAAAKEAVSEKEITTELPEPKLEAKPEDLHKANLENMINHAPEMTQNAGAAHSMLEYANEVEEDQSAPATMQ